MGSLWSAQTSQRPRCAPRYALSSTFWTLRWSSCTYRLSNFQSWASLFLFCFGGTLKLCSWNSIFAEMHLFWMCLSFLDQHQRCLGLGGSSLRTILLWNLRRCTSDIAPASSVSSFSTSLCYRRTHSWPAFVSFRVSARPSFGHSPATADIQGQISSGIGAPWCTRPPAFLWLQEIAGAGQPPSLGGGSQRSASWQTTALLEGKLWSLPVSILFQETT